MQEIVLPEATGLVGAAGLRNRGVSQGVRAGYGVASGGSGTHGGLGSASREDKEDG